MSTKETKEIQKETNMMGPRFLSPQDRPILPTTLQQKFSLMQRYKYLSSRHGGGEAIIPSLYHVEKKLIAVSASRREMEEV
mmetsp:Transcript_1344/g.3117  ORF Transcript_1344/g.3117 Transcript_1344/m.3117 type:complete len:81 (-) Transcript_1344:106-348(-)